ncbi:MAG: hypothetical protein QM778_20175 [Myxococcales bacterium]
MVVPLLAVLALVGVACGDDDAKGPPSYVGKQTSSLVTVSNGGKLEVGAVSVEIPKTAIDADKEITVKVVSKKGLPSEKEVAIDVYEFGPETKFSMPVKMTFDLKGVSVGNKKADIAYLDEEKGAWEKLTDSVTKDGKVTATTDHFSQYTVLLSPGTGGGGGGGFGLACQNTGFSACGGDPTGTWTYQTACSSSLPDAADGGIALPCKNPGKYESGIEISGTITFNADHTYQVNQTTTTTLNWVIPLSCLTEVSQQIGQPYTCDMFSGKIEGDNCVAGTGDAQPSTLDDMGTFTIDGTTLKTTNYDADTLDSGIFEDAGVSPYAMAEFCVSGNQLRVRYADDSYQQGLITEFTATK